MSKPKRLFVLRHGHAQPFGYECDENRALTELGIAEVKAAAKAFIAQVETFDAIIVSPYLRAQQTAKVFLEELNSSLNIIDCPLIVPEGRKIEAAIWLDSQRYRSILVVTHQPFAHQFLDYLVDEPLPVGFSMTTATLVSVEGVFFAGACCQFRWRFSP
ncbi:SixA phosphatase family protein [Marinomonas sp. IMCC 4694]|uniref:SixA phosphatase family protein n=1 Tax=Marinomonas sp. IMCC 4694 TaxID=2605432 RepID=UPI0011E8132B|nr:phosphoglycerate mutase family protein [Marinomonas sp. IMCC 4694]TYL47734.1 histidine phosphatase family protein [Marinomonas sp. IMCC 4694]